MSLNKNKYPIGVLEFRGVITAMSGANTTIIIKKFYLLKCQTSLLTAIAYKNETQP